MEEQNKKKQENTKIEEDKQTEVAAEKDAIAKLKEIGLKEVSNKTFINLENLTALLEKDFAKLNKTKALGFIQILQREFDVDLNALKNEYMHFNSSDKSVEKELAHTKKQNFSSDEEENKKFLPYLLLALAALVGGYFLFSSGNASKSTQSLDLNVVKNDVVIEKAKESLLTLDKAYEDETNESDEVDLNKVVEKMFHVIDENESASEEDNATSAMPTDKNESNIEPAAEEKIALEDNNTLETIEKVAVAPAPIVAKSKVTKAKSKKVENSNPGGLFIEPIQKAWVGVIFLDSMKKKDFLIYHTLQLDAKKDQIILVGHKNFKIFNKQLEVGFKSKKMVRFLYKDGELREISKEEYKYYKGGTHW